MSETIPSALLICCRRKRKAKHSVNPHMRTSSHERNETLKVILTNVKHCCPWVKMVPRPLGWRKGKSISVLAKAVSVRAENYFLKIKIQTHIGDLFTYPAEIKPWTVSRILLFNIHLFLPGSNSRNFFQEYEDVRIHIQRTWC